MNKTMPGLADLELQDDELKPYMDPALLLDTLSPEDMEMWHNYNFFSDDNINSNSKDGIKEENIEMDYCFTSICPNDLINNLDGQLNQTSVSNSSDKARQQTDNSFNQKYGSIIDYNSSISSSSSSSSPNGDQQSYEYTPYLIDIESGDYNHISGLFQSNGLNEASSSSSTSSSPPCSILSSSSSIEYADMIKHESDTSNINQVKQSGIFNFQSVNKNFGNNSYQAKEMIKEESMQNTIMITKNNSHNYLINNKISKMGSTPIILVEANKTSLKQQNQVQNLANQKTASLNSKRTTILPPSPPSSFGSDNESDHSSTSTNCGNNLANSTHDFADGTKALNNPNTLNSSIKMINKPSSNKHVSILKSTTAGKSSNGLKAGALLKQIRHQPYSVKSISNDSHTNKSSNHNSKNNIMAKTNKDNSIGKNNDNINFSDDDCWPFLCSLSKLPTSGPILLTEEEKRTLIQEGHQVPSQLPLSKGEEKILKKIRRKIKNKISAQESRRKKKEYVDSLEKRMENYINENVELKRKLEDLELNNKSLMCQLQKMQASLVSQPSNLGSNNGTLASLSSESGSNNASTNQFGTFLMVLVLFFAVLLGVWSPLLSKDNVSCSAPASTAASTNSGASSSTRNTSNSIGSSSQQLAVASVTAIVSAASVVGVSIKTESMSPKMDPDEQQEFLNDSLKPKVLTPSNEDELMSVDTGSNSAIDDLLSINNQLNSNLNSIARSKTGTAVELTKVRPFIRKLPATTLQNSEPSNKSAITLANLQPTNIKKNTSDYVILNNSNEEGQIIIFNLASNSQQPASTASSLSNVNNKIISNENSNDSKSNTTAVPLSILGSKQMKMMGLNHQNYKVINTPAAQIAKSQLSTNVTASPSSSPKLPRFRVINNSLNNLSVSLNNGGSGIVSGTPVNINPSIIKLSS